MGLFANTLLNTENFTDSAAGITITAKNTVHCSVLPKTNRYTTADVKLSLYDSLQLTNYRIKKLLSVLTLLWKVTRKWHRQLQQQRYSIYHQGITAIPGPQIVTSITANENWVEVFGGIRQTVCITVYQLVTYRDQKSAAAKQHWIHWNRCLKITARR